VWWWCARVTRMCVRVCVCVIYQCVDLLPTRPQAREHPSQSTGQPSQASRNAAAIVFPLPVFITFQSDHQHTRRFPYLDPLLCTFVVFAHPTVPAIILV
jgi:hypothetical protein